MMSTVCFMAASECTGISFVLSNSERLHLQRGCIAAVADDGGVHACLHYKDLAQHVRHNTACVIVLAGRCNTPFDVGP